MKHYFLLFKYCILILISCLFATKSRAQSTSDQAPSETDKWNALKKMYFNNQLSDSAYLDTINRLSLMEVSTNNVYETNAYLNKMALFKKLAWSNSHLDPYKIRYYIILKNNSGASGRSGEEIYFAEKADEEAVKQGKINPLVSLSAKYFLLQGSQNPVRFLEIATPYIPFLKRVPELIKQGSIDIRNTIAYINAVEGLINSYIRLKDSIHAKKYIQLLSDYTVAIEQQTVTDSLLPFTLRKSKYLLLFSQSYYEIEITKNYDKAAQYWRQADTLLNNQQFEYSSLDNFHQSSLLHWKFYLYIKAKDNAKAREALIEFNNFSLQSQHKPIITHFFEAQLESNEGNYEKAYNLAIEAFNDKDKLLAQLSNDVQELLYAKAESEYNKSEKEKADVELAAQTKIAVFLILLLLSSIVITFFVVRKKSKKIKRQIANTNLMTNIKIAEIEEEKTMAIKNERERLAQELHDDFSSMIASAKHQTDALLLEKDPQLFSTHLETLQKQIHSIYDASRTKSHSWFYDLRTQQQQSFARSVVFLTNSALPDLSYKKIIEVEEEAIFSLSANDRINILRILQEALTNIIKHSKAKEVSIFLFKSAQGIKFEISDDGKGFEQSQLIRGLGLGSIQNRVNQLNGNLKIYNDNGTVISIEFPESSVS